MKIRKPTSGMNLRDALWLAPHLGARVFSKPATDDVVVSHPLVNRSVVQSLGRKDANRELTQLLRRVWTLLHGPSAELVHI